MTTIELPDDIAALLAEMRERMGFDSDAETVGFALVRLRRTEDAAWEQYREAALARAVNINLANSTGM